MSLDQIRQLAEDDLLTFIRLVAPHRVIAPFHEEVIGWWTRQEAKSHQLVLVPRDHAKSALVAYRVAWRITRDPAVRILYISSTANLAEKQLKMVKDILTSKIYRRYWPDMIHPDEGKREKWTASEISVDHPKRREEGVRDPTVFTGGLTTVITGMHCDVAVLDDVVVAENAYTEEGREKVRSQYSLLSSIEGADAQEWVVGTRYHPLDLYNDMIEMEEEQYSSDGELISSEPVYEVFLREVETNGDGSGEYLWPRMQRGDGKWFGFNQQILARKKAQYLDKTQFYAQYYNNPNKYDTSLIDPSKFQYYDKSQITLRQGRWYARGQPLNIYASMDLAFTMSKKSDYSVIVVIGIDPNGFIYVLDIDRFKTDRIAEMFDHIRDIAIRWSLRRLKIESSAAQVAVVRELKDQYIRPSGLALSLEEYRPTRNEGTKEERILATLQPRYDNQSIWHYKGGNCTTLEEELKMQFPPHDDVKDALASAVTGAVPPRGARINDTLDRDISYNSRFGGLGFN